MSIKRIISILIISLLIIFNVQEISAQISSVVNSNQVYTYQIMTRDLKNLSEKYPEIIEMKEIGKSEYGRSIWAVKLGNSEVNVFFNGAHHAREWLTTTLLVKMIEEYAVAYMNDQTIEGYNARDLLDKTSIWFVPMVNPDGVTLQQGGLGSFPRDVQEKLIKINKGSKNFIPWKADARGIDPNRQYPANWNDIRGVAKAPASNNYKGTKPLITKENNALVNFTNDINPEIVVAYHSSGRIIYWYFYNKAENMSRDKKIADKLSSITGYPLVKPAAYADGGGYKDWFIQRYNRPGYTIEIGKHVGEKNLPLSAFDEEWKRNKSVGMYIASEGYKLWNVRFQSELKIIMKSIEDEEAKIKNLAIRDKEDFVKLSELYKKARLNDIVVFIDGEKKVFETLKPYKQENEIMIPLEEFAKYLNLKIEIDRETKEAIIYKGDKVIKISPNQNTVYIDDNPVSMGASTLLIEGQIIIPFSFISEIFEIHSEQVEEGQILIIETEE